MYIMQHIFRKNLKKSQKGTELHQLFTQPTPQAHFHHQIT